MQIIFEFACRECGADARILWDTAFEGAGSLPMKCFHCGHVSGEILPRYTFRDDNRPNSEKTVGESSGN